MPIEEVVEKYLQLIKTEDFAKYEKDFASKVQIGLIEVYKQGFYEPEMVSIVEGIINNLNGLSVSTNRVKISTKSIFIHGNKSQVEFEYYGKRVQRELGGLIFILSVIYNGIKYFEKFTISQFKKDDDNLRWDLSNKEQIYLLSRFPSFRGIRGSIIPMREFNLPNYSGCLGSFNLLFRPGDFVFVSAPQLENSVGNRKSLSKANISKLEEPSCYYFPYPIPFYWPDIEELFYFWRKLWRHGKPIAFSPPYFIGILGFSRSASNIHEFVDKYLRGNIGELTYSGIGIYNTPAFEFLRELLSAIMIKAQKEKKDEFIDFINEFFRHPYGGNEGGMREDVEFDYEGGGIGIIYTSINLGEGEE
jgi:hypothetical protein